MGNYVQWLFICDIFFVSLYDIFAGIAIEVDTIHVKAYP